jgi:hypothetical protein
MTFACARRPISDISDAGCQSCQTKTPLSGTKGTENHSDLGSLRPIAVHFGRATVTSRPKRQVSAGGRLFLTNLLARARYRYIDLFSLITAGGAAEYSYGRHARARRFVRRAIMTTCENRQLSGSHVPLPSRPLPASGVQQNAPVILGRLPTL